MLRSVALLIALSVPLACGNSAAPPPDGGAAEQSCGNGLCEPELQETVVSCAQDCSCGNGVVDEGEACDSADLGGKTCAALGFTRGSLACTQTCAFDTSGCDHCGDGQKQPEEACDQSDLGGQSCTTSGFAGGDLKCTSDCALDTTGCFRCGDGKKNGAEKCDGSDLGDQSCQTLGFFKGTLSCGFQCAFDTSGCSNCGNGVRDPGEDCEGQDLGGKSCESLGFGGGALKCSASCGFDKTGCTVTANFVDNGDGTVKQLKTGQLWQQGTGGSLSWASAKAYCANLNLAGQVWRLPTIDELRTLVIGCPDIEPKGACTIGNGCDQFCLANECFMYCDMGTGPGPGGCFMEGILGPCAGYWSSSSYKDFLDEFVWTLAFDLGGIYRTFPSAQNQVRCVH